MSSWPALQSKAPHLFRELLSSRGYALRYGRLWKGANEIKRIGDLDEDILIEALACLSSKMDIGSSSDEIHFVEPDDSHNVNLIAPLKDLIIRTQAMLIPAAKMTTTPSKATLKQLRSGLREIQNSVNWVKETIHLSAGSLSIKISINNINKNTKAL